ncbi:MAG: nucleotidyltransferase family protein [Eubacterium sp.]|nr:nucleotidyltransferase family protein [Eubacterium sp.]
MSEARKKEVSFLIELLSRSLNEKEPPAAEGVDFSFLLTLAKKHQVYNIIFPLISETDGIDAQLKQEFRNYSLSELKRMLVMNDERERIFSALSEKGIRFMPLKGLILKAYYPKESMRQMSDNDILYDAENRDAVARIMKENGYKPTATGENSDDYHKPPFSTFEFHRTLFFEEHDFCPRFDNLWENASPDDDNPCLYHMGLNDVYIYNVCHMYKHYSTAGCGIRFLADNYLFLKKESGRLDYEYISSRLSEYGIADFERETRKLAFKLFDGEELTENDEKLLEVFINFGIFGSGKIKLTRELEGMGGSLESAKKQYLLKRLFPPVKKMKADYRVLEKRPYLLPVYYIYRLFKGAANPEKTLGEVKDIRNIKNEE